MIGTGTGIVFRSEDDKIVELRFTYSFIAYKFLSTIRGPESFFF